MSLSAEAGYHPPERQPVSPPRPETRPLEKAKAWGEKTLLKLQQATGFLKKHEGRNALEVMAKYPPAEKTRRPNMPPKTSAEVYNTQPPITKEPASQETLKTPEVTKSTVDLKELTEQHNVVFAHGFSELTSTHIRGNWIKQLQNILVNPRISLCSVSTTENDDFHNLYTQYGVILSGGDVENAAPHDIGSATDETGQGRTTLNQKVRLTSVSEQVENAINNRGSRRYNEFNVIQPGIAGIYVCTEDTTQDTPERMAKNRVPPATEITAFAQEYQMPIFAMEKGQVYQARLNQTTNKFEKTGDPIDPKEIMEQKYNLSPEKREEIVQSFAEDFPFSPTTATLQRNELYLTQIGTGRDAYTRKSPEERCTFLKANNQFTQMSPEDAFRLYAFADEANAQGDEANATKAREIAQKTLPVESYQRFLSHSKPGTDHLVYTPQEVEQYLATGELDLT